MKRARTAIIGLGNYLLADEGAGLHAIHLLEKKLKDKEVDIIEGGTSGMNLLHQFDEREKIIFIDAGDCGLKPGEYRRFRPAEVISRKETRGYSMHEFDLIKFLNFTKRIHNTENVDIVIYCIQPAEIKIAEKLSPIIKKSLPFLVQKVYNEVIKGLCRE